MDFFRHQEVARRKTFRLVLFFGMAVVAILASVYVAAVLVFTGLNVNMDIDRIGRLTWWRPELFLPVAAGTLGVIFSGSVFKTMSLAGGGSSVAEMLGGRLVNRNTTDLDERVLLNVVDEVAIASGVPCPPVYVMDREEGINAFAAGFRVDDAVIGVTRGCIQQLTRDELQGVIAHEFSHILNGDMRLNLRLMGLLHGILLLGLTGYWIMRSGGGGGGRRGRGGAIIFFGLALLVIGYVGVFFAKLIKAAVSRQREYLADASAVQFTRNPGGIAGALKKIGGAFFGARLESPNAEQASHMFFGNALRPSFLNMLSTHPPLDDRIRRIDPSFDGSFPRPAQPARSRDDVRPLAGLQQLSPGGAAAAASGRQWSVPLAFQTDQAMDSVGRPLHEDITEADYLESITPQDVHDLVGDPFGARAAIFGLLLDEDPAIRSRQMSRLESDADAAVVRELRKHLESIDRVSPEARLAVVQIAIPALKQLTRKQHTAFHNILVHLIRADEEIRLFEFLLRRMVLTHLESVHAIERKEPRFRAAPEVLAASGALLSALAQVGHASDDEAERAYGKGMGILAASYGRAMPSFSGGRLDLAAADRALGRLSSAATAIKERVLRACATCIETDGTATVEEIQLLRVIAESLNCPMPPLVAKVKR